MNNIYTMSNIPQKDILTGRKLILKGKEIYNSSSQNIDVGQLPALVATVGTISGNITLGLLGNVVALETSVSSINDDIEELNSQLSSKATYSYVDTNITTLNTKINLKANMTDLNSSINTVNNSIASNVSVVNSSIASNVSTLINYFNTNISGNVSLINANMAVVNSNVANLSANTANSLALINTQIANINANVGNIDLWNAQFNTGTQLWEYSGKKSGSLMLSMSKIDTNTIYASHYYTKNTGGLLSFLDDVGEVVFDTAKSVVGGSKIMRKIKLGAQIAGGLVLCSVVASTLSDLADLYTTVSADTQDIMALASALEGVFGVSIPFTKYDVFIQNTPAKWHFALLDDTHANQLYSLKLKNYPNIASWNSGATQKLNQLSLPIAMPMDNRVCSIGNVLYYNGSAVSPIQTNSINIEGTSVHSLDNTFTIYTNGAPYTSLAIMCDNDGGSYSESGRITKHFGSNLAISSKLSGRTDLEIGLNGDTKIYGNAQFNKALQINTFVPDNTTGNLYSYSGSLYWGNTNISTPAILTDYFPKSSTTGLSDSDLQFGANCSVKFSNFLTTPADTSKYMYVKSNVLYYENNPIGNFTGNYLNRDPTSGYTNQDLKMDSSHNIYLYNKTGNDSNSTDNMLECVNNHLCFNADDISGGLNYLSGKAPQWDANIATIKSNIATIESSISAIISNTDISFNDFRASGNIVAGQLSAPSTNLTGRIISYNNKASPIFDQYIGNTLTSGNTATLMDYRLISADTVSKYKLSLDHDGVVNEYVKSQKNVVSIDNANHPIYGLITAGNTTYQTIQPPGNDYTYCQMGCGEMGGLQKTYLALKYGTNVSNSYKYQIDLLSGYLQHSFDATSGDTGFQTNGVFSFKNTSSLTKVEIDTTPGNTALTVKNFGFGYGYGLYMNSVANGSYTANQDGMVWITFRCANVEYGRVYCTSTGTNFVTSSDYRLKFDIQPMNEEETIERMRNLRTRQYRWLRKPDRLQRGFIAHELAEDDFKLCCSGSKDEVDADGNPVYQGIDTSLMMADVATAIKWLIKRCEANKQDIDQLKTQVEELATVLAETNCPTNFVVGCDGTLCNTPGSRRIRHRNGKTGKLNVIFMNGEALENGDLLESYISGYARKQEDYIQKSSTYARVRGDYPTSNNTVSIGGITYNFSLVDVDFV